MTEIETIFKQTLQDKVFTRSEQQAVRKLLKELAPDEREKDLLRSKIFDIARESISGTDNNKVLDWLESANKLVSKSESDISAGNDEAYFSPGNECLNAIISMIKSARKKIDICVFTISDNRITEQIIAAHKRRINVRILTDDDKTFDKGSDIEWLSRSGVPVKVDRTRNHMHHKFAIADDTKLLTGSYNWTRSAALYNEENILITENTEMITAYQNEFNQLWQQMRDY